MLVRTHTIDDCQAIADIYNESIFEGQSTMDCHPFGAKDIQTLMEKFHPRETALVVERNHQVIGWGMIRRYSDRPGYRVCCETSTYLALSETGKGYGTRLQKALLQQVVDFGYHHVVTKICASNQGSINFHKRFGFEVVGIQKEIGFLQGRWHDVMIMQLVLPEVPPYCPDSA
ncbi:MAG: N-acetyltransferase [Cyanothece sp. SIO1E1]|nr:N-acetyltransferase [Cyanothece sp. SIO1E1]